MSNDQPTKYDAAALQRDVEAIDIRIRLDGIKADEEAWQRIRARLTPDRERVARAIAKAIYVSDDAVEDPKRGTKGYMFWLPVADAAIDAARGAK